MLNYPRRRYMKLLYFDEFNKTERETNKKKKKQTETIKTYWKFIILYLEFICGRYTI